MGAHFRFRFLLCSVPFLLRIFSSDLCNSLSFHFHTEIEALSLSTSACSSMAINFWPLACIQTQNSRNLTPRPHYPSMPKYPAGVSAQENDLLLSETTAFFSVTGMTCSACAGSVEKAVKRLPGIREAVVDVLNAKARVQFYPSFVNVCIFLSFLRACFLIVFGYRLVCALFSSVILKIIFWSDVM